MILFFPIKGKINSPTFYKTQKKITFYQKYYFSNFLLLTFLYLTKGLMKSMYWLSLGNPDTLKGMGEISAQNCEFIILAYLWIQTAQDLCHALF